MTDNTVKALRELAVDVNYTASSTIASTALSILNEHKITGDNISDLLVKLSRIERPLNFAETSALKLSQLLRPTNPGLVGEVNRKTLVHWFFRLAHPSNTHGGREMRKWLMLHKVTLSEIRQYYDYEIKDQLDFAVGFLLGAGKSLTYDNVKGLYDLVGLGVEIQLMINDYEADLLNRLVRQYAEKRDQNVSLAIQSSIKLQEALRNALLNNKSMVGYREVSAIGSFLSEIRILFVDFCMSPFLKFVDDEASQKFDLLVARMNTFVGKEQEEHRKAGSIWNFAISGYKKELEKKVYPLLLEYRMFEAGIAAGNLTTDIAQLVIGIFMLFLDASKLVVKGGKLAVSKLLTLPAADKVKALALLSAININAGYLRRIPQLTIDSPAILLVLESDEVKKISSAMSKELAFFESKNAKILDMDVAASLSQNSRKPLFMESSVTGGDSTYLLQILGLMVLLRRRRKGAELTDAYIKGVKNLFTKDFARKLTRRISNAKKPDFEDFLMDVAAREGITVLPNKNEGEKLRIIIDELVKQFQTHITKEIKKGATFKKRGIYSRFNSFVNKKIRVVSKEKAYEGLVILIDERLDNLLATTLNPNGVILSAGKSVKISDLFKMTIHDFYKKFYPDRKMSEMYHLFTEKIKNNGGRKLYAERDELLGLIENAKGKNVDTLIEKYEMLTVEINTLIQKLIDGRKITISDSDKIVLKVFGKLNIKGKCGAARPDLAIMDLTEGNKVYDLLHAADKHTVDSGHLIGSDFYQDFLRVLFGEVPMENKVTEDIIYTFSSDFVKKLK